VRNSITQKVPGGDVLAQIEELGGQLRSPLSSILESVSAPLLRPARISRAFGLDKSLASRLVRAIQADSNLELMHIVPSPAGLRILAELASSAVDRGVINELRKLTEQFEDLLHAVPGGRAALDAQISESSQLVRERREQIAKQASFKSMSFLLGHFSELLTTSLFLVPSENGRTVDGIEVHRRIGFRRMRPRTPVALLSFHSAPEDDPGGDAIRFETIHGSSGDADPTAFLIPDFSSDPIPELEVVRDDRLTTLVLAGDPSVHAPAKLTSAFRIRNAWSLTPSANIQTVRGYVLHVPCAKLVRDLFIAEDLFPGATPRISFSVPGPRANPYAPGVSERRHFAAVDLTASIEQLPATPRASAVPGLADQTDAIRYVLEQAGQAGTRFRGWRCAMTYPVPLVEMMWWLFHPTNGGS
jgi:hypothetical protein